MEFVAGTPKMGDMVRVKLGSLWHYGIYVSDAEVIQFGMPPDPANPVPKEQVRVLATDMDTFRQGRFVEVAKLTLKERLTRRPPSATVAMARERIGEAGYDAITNNCEHFANECLMKRHVSRQTDSLAPALTEKAAELAGTSPRHGAGDIHVYLMPVSGLEPGLPTGCACRDAEIAACGNAGVRREKQLSYQLLAHALEKTYGMEGADIGFSKDAAGRPCVKNHHVSISHTDGFVAVAVADVPVGLDLERADRLMRQPADRLAEAILSAGEMAEYRAATAAAGTDKGTAREPERDTPEKTAFLLTAWTGKESLYKAFGTAGFVPREWDTAKMTRCLSHKELLLDGTALMTCVAVEGGQICVHYCLSAMKDGIINLIRCL